MDEKKESCSTCGQSQEHCSSCSKKPEENSNLSKIRNKILVLSGKGGVGKSTIAVNLAVSLLMAGKKVGLMDVDIHGPSIPTMLGLEAQHTGIENNAVVPIDWKGLKVVSIGFFLPNQDEPIIWRGPLKTSLIQQFIKDVAWGELDFLIVDSPPGTGDEHLSLCQLMDKVDGAVVVTTPQKVASVDVRKCVSFCKAMKLPVLGIVENMNGFVCPHCNTITPILLAGGGAKIAQDMQVPFLGSIPIDPQIAQACDEGKPFLEAYSSSPTAKIMQKIVNSILEEKKTGVTPMPQTLKIAIPVTDGKLCLHFGHCANFAMMDVDVDNKKILKREDLAAPPHQPGLLPPWLAERGAQLIIAGGIGQRAQSLFTENKIQVLVGAPSITPEEVVNQYLAGTLNLGQNVCDH